MFSFRSFEPWFYSSSFVIALDRRYLLPSFIDDPIFYVYVPNLLRLLLLSPLLYSITIIFSLLAEDSCWLGGHIERKTKALETAEKSVVIVD